MIYDKTQINRINRIIWELEQTEDKILIVRNLYSGDTKLLEEKGLIVEPLKIVVEISGLKKEYTKKFKDSNDIVLNKIYTAKWIRLTNRIICEYTEDAIKTLKELHISHHITRYRISKKIL